MKFILRITLLLIGLSLIIIAISGHILRRDPSTAYWVLGEITDGDDHSLYLSSPNGAIQRRIVAGKQANRASLMEWLPDGNAFLYMWRSDQLVEEVRRYSLDTQESDRVSLHTTFSTDSSSQLVSLALNQQYLYDIPHHTEKTITLRPDQEAIFTISPDGRSLQQLTPFHTSILSKAIWSPDGEWLYYVARDIDNPNRIQPTALYRQRFDGSNQTELMWVDRGDTLSLFRATATDVFITLVHAANDNGGASIIHLSTIDGTQTRITPDDDNFRIIDIYPTGKWIFVGQFNELNGANRLFRLSFDGQDFTPILEVDPDRNPIAVLHTVPPDEIIAALNEDTTISLFRIDIASGQHTPISLTTPFSRVYELQTTTDGQVLYFTGISIAGAAHYRLNLATNQLDELSSVPIVTRSTNSVLTSSTLAATDSHMLIVDLAHGISDYTLDFYRLNLNSGHYDRLLSETSTNAFPSIYPIPSDPNTLIISIEEHETVAGTTRQYRFDVSSGDVHPISLGRNLKFSPIIDRNWAMDTLLLGGIGLLILGLGWSTLRFWRYERA